MKNEREFLFKDKQEKCYYLEAIGKIIYSSVIKIFVLNEIK